MRGFGPIVQCCVITPTVSMPIGFLGIDAGGTRCRARLVSGRGEVIGEGAAGPANTGIGLERLFHTLVDVSEQAVRAAGLAPADLGRVAAGIGIAGMSRPGAMEKLRDGGLPF